jgi:hypothetical protein
MKYTFKYMSQVHKSNTQPVNNGWYLSCMDYNNEELLMVSLAKEGFDSVETGGEFFWYCRDGEWYAGEGTHQPASNQNRRWIGRITK